MTALACRTASSDAAAALAILPCFFIAPSSNVSLRLFTAFL
jgi:hypothetical protein